MSISTSSHPGKWTATWWGSWQPRRASCATRAAAGRGSGSRSRCRASRRGSRRTPRRRRRPTPRARARLRASAPRPPPRTPSRRGRGRPRRTGPRTHRCPGRRRSGWWRTLPRTRRPRCRSRRRPPRSTSCSRRSGGRGRARTRRRTSTARGWRGSRASRTARGSTPPRLSAPPRLPPSGDAGARAGSSWHARILRVQDLGALGRSWELCGRARGGSVGAAARARGPRRALTARAWRSPTMPLSRCPRQGAASPRGFQASTVKDAILGWTPVQRTLLSSCNLWLRSYVSLLAGVCVPQS
mmetsp:Transcript_21359/g.51452  ORF Transcript_21359/g.51452 Transcript_21359/m.51452 type:complete len:299 (+) Transcript_21359:1229-2125(+)